MASPFEGVKRLVVKIGSALLVSPEGEVERYWLASLIDDLETLRRENGIESIIVASGAVALGARILDLPAGGKSSLDDGQASAATGQIELSGLFSELLRSHRRRAAQILVTLEDLQDRRRYLNASDTIERLLSLDVTPIINENDSVTTREIRFGDNDRLAARVAQAAHADMVLLLSNVTGLFSADPGKDPDAVFLKTVNSVADLDVDLGPPTGPGTGGMGSKVEAARIAVASGIQLAIADGQKPNPVIRFRDTGDGTVFTAEGGVDKRKAWIAGKIDVQGTLTVNAGAKKHLLSGDNLLTKGVTHVEGEFSRGDSVDIHDEDGQLLARGLISYDDNDAKAIAGKQAEEQEAILGYAPRSALIDKNNLVLLI
ncbi:glutamate 5-kinase [Novosphingopyxis baekryungensis]|jgi:glutamate 5-kinase|uniref:glutamate 5-kinase n=1 Tax=Novosphingopyxis baekryungensis TaxID=279369 RepID=UPI0003B48302|nr:glutamate 5-kinase [Novosphingopyxis baekryungensis]